MSLPVKRAIPDFIFDEVDIPDQLMEVLRVEFHCDKNAGHALKAVKRSRISSEAKEVLAEELREIIDDLKFSSTKRGEFIHEVANSYKSWEASLLAEYSIKDLMIRAHTESQALAVAGTAEKGQSIDEIIAKVEALTGYRVIPFLRIDD